MAVYKRTYQGYEGRLTPGWSRFLIITRYAYERVFDSKFLLTFLVSCLVWPAICAAIIYFPHNSGAMALLHPSARNLIPINGNFFLRFMAWQGSMAFLLTAFVSPGLISSDLRNNALPLYFCRPFSRAEYVLGKMAVLVILLSAITWIPGLLLFGLEAVLEGSAWFWDNLWMAKGVFLGSWIWILVLSLLGLALSAWVRWKLAAAALLFAVFFVAAGFGQAINNILHTDYGKLINLVELIGTIWAGLFRTTPVSGLTEFDAWEALLGICAFCLYLLARKVKAYEVVRS